MPNRTNAFLLALVIALSVVVVAMAVRLPSHLTVEQVAAAQKGIQKDVCQYSPLRCFWNWTTHDPVAFFTFVLAIFTGVLGTSTIGLWLQTRRAADVANAALTEIERAFVASGFQVAAIVNPNTNLVLRWEVMTIWKNSGSTPARRVFTHSSWDHFADTLAPDFTFPDFFSNPPEQNTMSFIPPKDQIVGDPLGISTEILDAARMGWIKVYIWGWIEYDDVFVGSAPHRTEFCHEIMITGDPYAPPGQSRPPLRFQIYPKHTGADEGCYRNARPAHLRHIPLS